jgi:hypothetical protein
MIFLPTHSTNPNEAKGIKAVLTECGPNMAFTRQICKGSARRGASNACCNKRILELQPDFMEQKYLVQEIIEGAGHLCLFLLKFHCELNPIEYFWGTVQNLKYHCD